jgi:hypothetical protein
VATGPVRRRQIRGGLEKMLSLTGDQGFESSFLQRRAHCEPDFLDPDGWNSSSRRAFSFEAPLSLVVSREATHRPDNMYREFLVDGRRCRQAAAATPMRVQPVRSEGD